MADVKISALPAATTPLAGTELVPIVQSGVTSQVSVANMTAGRTVSASTVLIGTTTQRTIAGQTTEFLIERPAASRAALVRNTNDANGPIVFTAKSRGTVNGSYTVVASGDALGTWNFTGSDGTADVLAASIRADVDGTPGTNDMPGRLVFSTTADGASFPTERMRINAAGNVGIGTSVQTARFEVVGGTLTTSNPATYAVGVANTGGANRDLALGSDGTYAYVQSFAGKPLYFNSVGNNVLFGSGNVGIGTASPSANLDVRGTGSRFIRARSDDTTGAAIGYVGAEFGTNASLQIRAGNGYTYLVSTGATDPLLIGTNNTERMRITETGNVGIGTSSAQNRLQVNGSFGRGAPVTKTGNFTLADTENWIICNGAGSITVTFPAASSWTGREVMIKTIAAQTVVSASSNVVPLAGGAAGTAILPATAGSWATLVSDGTNWIIMQS